MSVYWCVECKKNHPHPAASNKDCPLNQVDVRAMKVTSCKKCTARRYDNGGGFIEPFHICKMFGIMLIDGKEWTDLDKIHKDCKLPKWPEGGSDGSKNEESDE